MRLILNKELLVLEDMIPLAMLPIGDVGEIVEVLGDENDVKRMSELGLRKGSLVEVVQSGSPCIVRFGETKMCFRDSELLKILVLASSHAL
jgi:ferrous iron transport protein A